MYMNIMTVVLLIIFVFAFTPLVIVEFARVKSTLSLEDFFLLSRKMPLLLSFFTVYATWVSSFAFIGATSSFFSDGPLYMTCFAWNILFGLLFMVIGKKIWILGKTFSFITPIDFFSTIYKNKALNIIITVILVVFTMPYLMIQLYGGAYIIETISGGMIPWRAAGLIFYMVIIIYLWAGGLRALAMTDVFYGIIVFITMLLSGIIFIEKTGGIKATFSVIMKNDMQNVVLGTSFSPNSPTIWLCMFLIIPIGALMGPPMWIRAYAIKEEKIFNIMPLLLSIATIMYLGPLFVGASAKVMYPNISGGDTLIPFMLINNAPIILATLLLCGIAAAALSTANSQIHSLSAIYTIDIHKRYINKQIQERQLINISKWTILLLSVITYILMLKNPGMIIETGLLGMSGTAQILVPTLGALYWEKSKGTAAAWGLIVGIGALCYLCLIWKLPAVLAAVIAMLLNLLIFVLVSALLPHKDQTAKKIKDNKTLFNI